MLTYTVTVTDNNATPLSDSDTVTVTITGTNDAPTISGGPVLVNLTETNSNLSAAGTLTVADTDTSNTVSANRTLVVSGSSDRADPAAPNDASLLAMFSVSPTTITRTPSAQVKSRPKAPNAN